MKMIIQCAVAVLVANMVIGPASMAEMSTGSSSAQPPDLNGNWGLPDPSEPIDPALIEQDGPPPVLTPEYAAKHAKLRALIEAVNSNRGVSASNLNNPFVQRQVDCLPYGMPRMMQALYSIEILQSPKQVVIISESMPEVRRIYLNKPQLPLAKLDLSYSGRSVGHWEGNTLVVSTAGIKEDVLFSARSSYMDAQDMPHSIQAVITERIRLLAPDVLQDRVTISDPVAFVRPYEIVYTLARLKDYETPEYVCDNKREHFDVSGKMIYDVQSSGKQSTDKKPKSKK